MESGWRNGEALDKASRIVTARGKVYVDKRGYIQLQIFSRNITELDLFVRIFSGNYYSHGSEFIWMVSRRTELEYLSENTDLPKLSKALKEGRYA